MARTERLKLYQFVADLVDSGIAVLPGRLGLNEAQARETMLAVAKHLCDLRAYSTVYIPAAQNLANLERNATIWADYQRDNPQAPYTKRWTPQRAWELAQQHQLTPQQVYSILKQERLGEVADVQPELPAVADSIHEQPDPAAAGSR